MVIFNSYVKLPEGTPRVWWPAPDSTGLGQAEEGADESGEDLETGGANDPTGPGVRRVQARGKPTGFTPFSEASGPSDLPGWYLQVSNFSCFFWGCYIGKFVKNKL